MSVMFVLQIKETELVNSEILPGFRDDGNICYDGKGYYMSFNTVFGGKKYV